MTKILFVCTGNTCRSSMAEGIFKKMIEKLGKETDGMKVISAGTAAFKDAYASKHAIQVMKEKEIDLSTHRARPLTLDLIDQADLILTMTRNHKNQVLNIQPNAFKKTFTLKEYANNPTEKRQNIDILDPFGQSEEVYRLCAQEIEEELQKILKKVLK